VAGDPAPTGDPAVAGGAATAGDRGAQPAVGGPTGPAMVRVSAAATATRRSEPGMIEYPRS
ncbi:hypothetical protein AB0J83_47275, partial [Actinoplanes sp. NPDC049596]|uniref:hypothetical protein n=1 Tax=Actinoplanes sp. NPDC049596 TaxID=3154625 RepID=UPI00341EF9B8